MKSIQYGDIINIRVRDEMWAAAYRYKVHKGVRIVEIKFKPIMPSNLNIVCTNVMIILTRNHRPAIGAMNRDIKKSTVPGDSVWLLHHSDRGQHGQMLFQTQPGIPIIKCQQNSQKAK